MKTNIIFACAMLCTSLGILSMEPDKTDVGKSSPAVNRRKRTATKSIKPSPTLSDPYRDYILHTSRNELVPEEVIKKLGRQTGQAARKHNKLVHCNIDGCSFINARPIKPAFKKEPTNLVVTDVQFPRQLSNQEHCSHDSQTDCHVIINIPSGKLTSREFCLEEYSPLQKIESPIGNRCSCVLL